MHSPDIPKQDSYPFKMTKIFLILVLFILTTAANAGQHIKDDSDYICTEQGRFHDSNDISCKRYHLCSAGKRGIWVKSSYNCPDGTIFDPIARLCSSNVKCRHQEYEPDLPSDYENDDFVCRKPGFHDDARNPYCSTYYDCKSNKKGVLFPVQVTCTPPYKFDPIARRCVSHYTCKREFRCSSVGRFDDGGDSYNKRYFLCTKRNSGEYVKTVYTCPLYSRFVAESSKCGIPDEIADDELDIHDDSLPIEDWVDLDGYICSRRGYYATTFSLRSFYLCDVMSDGELAKHIMSCPHGHFWDDDTALCTSFD